MDIQKIKDNAFKDAITELKHEYSKNVEALEKIEEYEEKNGSGETKAISK